MIGELSKSIRKGINFCEVSGGYITAFTLLLPQIIINIRSAIYNQWEPIFVLMYSYQGGCPYPYISEVGREGFNKILFEFSTLSALFPWIIFCMYYLDTNIKYGKRVIKGKYHYIFFSLMHTILCMLLCSSAFSFVIASMYDIIHYPIIHEKVWNGNWRKFRSFIVYNESMRLWKYSICFRCTFMLLVLAINLVEDETP